MIKLFSANVGAFSDDDLVTMPGFSHRSQPAKRRVCWYPFEEWTVKVWLFARNRTHATKQLIRAGRRDVRDLDGGSKATVPDCIAKALGQP